MRFIWAVVSFVIAALLITAGIAQRTVFLGSPTEQIAVAAETNAPYVLIDGGVLGRLPGGQTLVAKNDGPVFGAYGRTADVTAWLADSEYAHVTLDEDGAVKTETIAPAVETPELTEAQVAANDALTAANLPAPQPAVPAGSDLWLDEFSDDSSIIKQLALPAEMSVLLATDGAAPAPQTITLEWSVDNSTPWAGPLIALGGLAMLIGITLYILGIRHMRRSRGPRRRGPAPLTDTQALELGVNPEEKKGVISSSTRSGRKRRMALAVPVIGFSLVAMTGCTADAWPKFDAATPNPTPTATVVAPEDQQSPVVTASQAERIIDRVATAVAAADEAKSPELAQARLAGPALAERLTNYTLRATLTDEPALTAVPSKPYRIILPQAIDGWPRTIMAVWSDENDSTIPPRIMMFVQPDAWSAYKLEYIGQMEASAEIPALPPADIGANLVRLDSSLLTMAPDKLATAYAHIIDNGEKSEYAPLFDIASDKFLVQIRDGRAARLAAFQASGDPAATFTFSAADGGETPIGLQTLHSGAIVAVTVAEVDHVKPTEATAEIRTGDNKRVAALTGKTESATGFETTFLDQLIFYVPGQGSDEKITLIGFTSNILKAEVPQ